MRKTTKIAAIVLIVGLLSLTLVFGALGSGAWLFDTETSTGNSFTAGTLDLNLDGGNTNVVKFNVSNMHPGSQPTGSWLLKNVGSLTGYLDIEGVTLSSAENGILDMETDAGDTTAGVGELQDVVNIHLYFDIDKDGYWSVGDVEIWSGLVKNLPSHFELNRTLAANGDIKIMCVLDWWDTANDNQAQGDSMTIDFTFELQQYTAQ